MKFLGHIGMKEALENLTAAGQNKVKRDKIKQVIAYRGKFL